MAMACSPRRGGAPAHNQKAHSHSANGTDWAEPIKTKGKMGVAQKMAFGNGVFVSIGMKRRITTSEDGATWEELEDEDRPALVSITHGNGLFVAGGMHGLRMTSKDGRKWDNAGEGEIGEHLNQILWNGREFVAIGVEVTYKSPDGKRWQKFPSNVRPARACFGNGQYVCTNGRGTKVYLSDDACRWEEGPKPGNALLNGDLLYV